MRLLTENPNVILTNAKNFHESLQDKFSHSEASLMLASYMSGVELIYNIVTLVNDDKLVLDGEPVKLSLKQMLEFIKEEIDYSNTALDIVKQMLQEEIH